MPTDVAAHRVVVVAFEGVVPFDLSVPCEVFGRARGPSGGDAYRVEVCASRPVVAAAAFRVAVDHGLDRLDAADTVIVPGIDALDRPLDPGVVAALRRASERGARVASLCTGAFVLAATGRLDGHRATTHWLAVPELARRHPRVQVDPGVLYVDAGSTLTSAGACAGIDLCLHLVRRDLGAAAAADAARLAVAPLERMGGQAQYIPAPAPADPSSLAPILAWIEANLRADLSVDVLARRAAMSPRTFVRRFREQVGDTPARWVVRARVRRAQELLETSELPVDDVALRVGFGSAVTLRDRFRAVLRTTPLAYRRTFRKDPLGVLPPARGSGRMA